jgi:uncharacterized protein
MFSRLMPQRKEFYELLAAHSDRVVAGANVTLRMVSSLGTGTEDIPALVAEINATEKSADKIKADVIALLHKSFTTPINRDQIHTLTIEIDRVINALKSVANSVSMYNITHSTPEAIEMASLGVDACIKLNRAVFTLALKNRKDETVALCKEIDAIESKADQVQRQAISRLFEDGSSIWMALKMREFYSLQENVLDRCEDAAKTIVEILIENS